jgi:hypothetical protein
MTVTDPGLKPETLYPSGNGFPDGAAWISNPLNIMFDIDDVIFPTMMSIHELARLAGYHNNDVDPSWSGWESYNIPPQAYWDLWSDFAMSGGYVNTEPIVEATEAMRRLYYAGHRIHLVTARGFMAHASDIRAWTSQWVEEYAIPWHSLTFARDKVQAGRDLAHDYEAWGASPFFDFAIDDSPRNFIELREDGVEAYLLDHVHNKDHVADHRVASVDQFVDIVLKGEQ